MDDILFLSVFTKGYRDLAANHLNSLKRVGITNTLSFCNDKETVNILNLRGFKAYEFPYNENLFEPPSENFNNFSFVKYILINSLLKKNKLVWYLDVDTVVTKDIRKHIDLNKNIDIYIQQDVNIASTGGMLISNSDVCKNLMKKVWDKRNDIYGDQLILNGVLQNKNLNLKGQTLSMGHFRPGLFFFDKKFLLELSPSVLKMRYIFLEDKDIGMSTSPSLVHANFILGISNKISALKSCGLWLIT